MVTEVWGDLYFLINAGMDLICLRITAALVHRKIKRWRLALAALLGGGYALAALLWGRSGLPGLLGDCGAALLLTTVSFWERGIRARTLLRDTLLQCLVSMLLGGVMTALYSLLSRWNLPLEALGEEGISVWLFALLSLVSALIAKGGGRFFGSSHKTRKITVTAKIFGQSVTFTAMVDTGNLLRDPISGRGVILVDRHKLLASLPRGEAALLGQSDPAAWISDHAHAARIRLIPTHTATGHTLLPAIIPEELLLSDGKETLPSDHLIAPGALGENAKGFDAILPAE